MNLGRMRLLASLTSAAVLLGCGPIVAPPRLLTYDLDSCHPAPHPGLLAADPTYGTVLWAAGDGSTPPPGLGEPVAWPSGFTARYTGSEVEVVDGGGRVIAITGRRYELIGVGVDVGGIRAFGACGVFPR
jgi:hypothetical protein